MIVTIFYELFSSKGSTFGRDKACAKICVFVSSVFKTILFAILTMALPSLVSNRKTQLLSVL